MAAPVARPPGRETVEHLRVEPFDAHVAPTVSLETAGIAIGVHQIAGGNARGGQGRAQCATRSWRPAREHEIRPGRPALGSQTAGEGLQQVAARLEVVGRVHGDDRIHRVGREQVADGGCARLMDPVTGAAPAACPDTVRQPWLDARDRRDAEVALPERPLLARTEAEIERALALAEPCPLPDAAGEAFGGVAVAVAVPPEAQVAPGVAVFPVAVEVELERPCRCCVQGCNTCARTRSGSVSEGPWGCVIIGSNRNRQGPDESMRIAVIGGGIGGLSCAWALSRQHAVTLFEARASLGMDAFSIDIPRDGSAARVDVPMRVFFPEGYPTLTALYEAAGIETDTIDYAASFSWLDGPTIFRYRNHRIGGRSRSFLPVGDLLRPRRVRRALEVARFCRLVVGERRTRAELDEITVQDYLEQHGFTAAFVEEFVLPAYAGVCTCSYATLRNYPASVLLAFLGGGLLSSTMRRARHGARDVVRRLSDSVNEVRVGAPVDRLTLDAGGVQLSARGCAAERFDHVVVATQATHAGPLLPECATAERAILARFRYEHFELTVHRDPRLAPSGPQPLSPVNFLLSEGSAAPMATIHLNRIHAGLGAEPAFFETWNPLIEPEPSLVACRIRLERPVVDRDSLRAIDDLEALHRQPDRRLWFCGSYAAFGIPLQETAAASAFAVARRLGVEDLPG
jgi:predicted NAD/FAD-binding protein